MDVGSKRPAANTELGRALCTYCGISSRSYDLDFDKLIKKRQPQWWTADEKRKILLSLPKHSKRPSNKTPLGSALTEYMRKDRKSYNESFDKAIREKFPHWFVLSSVKNKKDILALPVESKRPSKKTKMGKGLAGYTKKTGELYDAKFDKEVRTRFPHWFRVYQIRLSEKLKTEKKKEILSLPRGSQRPLPRDPIWKYLIYYTRKSIVRTYDPEFDLKVRARFPHWFS